MKVGKEHVVLLRGAALAALDRVPRVSDEYVFSIRPAEEKAERGFRRCKLGLA
jgi:hypothetical protein